MSSAGRHALVRVLVLALPGGLLGMHTLTRRRRKHRPPRPPRPMTADDMAEPMESSGESFDTRFLTMMIECHKGAITLSRAEPERGPYGPARELAEEIIAAQQAGIDQMNALPGND